MYENLNSPSEKQTTPHPLEKEPSFTKLQKHRAEISRQERLLQNAFDIILKNPGRAGISVHDAHAVLPSLPTHELSTLKDQVLGEPGSSLLFGVTGQCYNKTFEDENDNETESYEVIATAYTEALIEEERAKLNPDDKEIDFAANAIWGSARRGVLAKMMTEDYNENPYDYEFGMDDAAIGFLQEFAMIREDDNSASFEEFMKAKDGDIQKHIHALELHKKEIPQHLLAAENACKYTLIALPYIPQH